MTSYAVLNAQGVCINRIVWDGVSDWSPPDGCTAVADPDCLYPLFVESEQQPEE